MTDFEAFFNAHTHRRKENEWGLMQLEEGYSEEMPRCFSIGVHPQNVTSELITTLSWMETHLWHPGFVAVGEIGLDSRCPHMNKQEEVYIGQLKLAEKWGKPIILHCVNAWDRCKFLHQKYAPNQSLIYHGFSKPSILEQVLAYPQAIISIGARVLSNRGLQASIQHIPNPRLLLETDNESLDIEAIYQQVSKLKNVSLPALKNEINQNAKRIFKL